MTRYASTVLWYQDTMASTAEPFAAVVEQREDDRVEIFCVWKQLDAVDPITKETLAKFPEVLHGYFREAISKGVRVVDTMASSLRWNIYASPPEVKAIWWQPPPLTEYGFQVFETHVDADKESVRKARDEVGHLATQHAYRIVEAVA